MRIGFIRLGACFIVLAAMAGILADGAIAKKGGGPSQASLDMSTPGCPTFFDPVGCSTETSWDLDKTTESGPFHNPDGEAFLFDVTVTEGPTGKILRGEGQVILTNSGEMSAVLSSISVSLEKQKDGRNCAAEDRDEGLGPSGKNWCRLATAIQVESTDCADLNEARSCYGDVSGDDGASLLLTDIDSNDVTALSSVLPIPATLDNDGDGLRDEDPDDITFPGSGIDNDGDGLVDEDPVAGIDNDNDGLVDEDPVDFDALGAPIDNDGDGLFNEDDADDDGDGATDEDDADDDGDGATDEDGACEDAVTINFAYEFNLTELGLEDFAGPGDGVVPSSDDLRINMIVTFGSAGQRGKGSASCALDANCNGIVDLDDPTTPLIDEYEGSWDDPSSNENNIRSIQQRHVFDPPACGPVCDTVELNDDGASSDADCVDVDPIDGRPFALSETIHATGEEGTETGFTVEGAVTCDCVSPLSELEDELDDSEGSDGFVRMRCYNPGTRSETDHPSYWDCQIDDQGAGSPVNGWWDSWCVDTDRQLGNGQWRNVQLVSTYDSDGVPTNMVDIPENLDEVNWLINQGYVGQSFYDQFGEVCGATAESPQAITYGDQQRAIWALIEDRNSTAGLGPYSNCRARELVKAACGEDWGAYQVVGHPCEDGQGSGFLPDCEQLVAVLLNPVNGEGVTNGQVNIFEMPLNQILDDCDDSCVECFATVTNTATLVCEDGSGLVSGSPASASFDVDCSGFGGSTIETGDFCTQTQGGWGTDTCRGNNTACLRDENFDDLFLPGGLIVGDSDGPDEDNLYSILLTSSAAVAHYLPAGGTASRLTADQIDPLVTSSGVFGGQLTAATMNLAFDDAGIGKDGPSGNFDPGTLGTLIYADGCNVDPKLVGQTVDQVVAWSNCVIQGESFSECGVPGGVSLSNLNKALSVLNENFVDCDTNLGCLELP